MSGRPDEPGRPESTTDDRNTAEQHYHHAASAIESHPRPRIDPTVEQQAPTQQTQARAQGHQRTFELPPLPAQTTGDSSSRLAGVASILNQSPTDDSHHGRRRKASELESQRVAPSLPPLSSVAPDRSPPGDSYEHQQRRILTPKSPSQKRNSLNQSIGAITSSPRPRGHTLEFATSNAQHTPSAVQRHSYGFPGPPSSDAARRSGAFHGAGQAPESASPTTSYSPYSQADLMSPAVQQTTHTMSTLSAPYSTSSELLPGAGPVTSAPRHNNAQDRQRPVGIPLSSAGGQNIYQMMTLETTAGTLQLPVDVQAASRGADEKRRRNAGASARFRQRRKEKERESSTTISRLEQRLKELADEADFYKRERDYMASVVRQTPGGDRHFPRPPSPIRRRRSSPMMDHSNSSYVTQQEEASQSPDEDRKVRRRTPGYSLPPPQSSRRSLPPASITGPPYQPGYGAFETPYSQQFMGPHASAITRGSLPSPSAAPRGPAQQLPPPPPHALPPPNSGPWNPYAPERRAPGPPTPH